MERIFLNEHLRNKFGERVQRIPVDPGFACPNRINNNGCIFCSEQGSAASWIKKGMSFREQLMKGEGIARRRYKSKKFIIYFQAFTSTYASVKELDRLYKEALSFPGVVGLAISTRPDCINDDILDLLSEYNKRTYLWVELGAQSMIEDSLLWMGRGHSVSCFTDTVNRLKSRGIEVVGHIIFGLPTETKKEMITSFKSFISTGINGYKIHALHIIKGTQLELMYRTDQFRLLDMNEYIELVEEAVKLTPKDIVIHRLTAECDISKLVAPLWVLKKDVILGRIKGDLGL